MVRRRLQADGCVLVQSYVIDEAGIGLPGGMAEVAGQACCVAFVPTVRLFSRPSTPRFSGSMLEPETGLYTSISFACVFGNAGNVSIFHGMMFCKASFPAVTLIHETPRARSGLAGKVSAKIGSRHEPFGNGSAGVVWYVFRAVGDVQLK